MKKRIITIVLCLCLIMLAVSSCNNTSDSVLDLTKYSQTMRYSTVENMLSNSPSDFLGKTIKIPGYYAKGTDGDYHFVVVVDGTGCCTLGVEFILDSNEYPNEGTEVVIEGVYEQYYEGEYVYYHLVNAKLS